jgi:hypothetical protein
VIINVGHLVVASLLLCYVLLVSKWISIHVIFVIRLASRRHGLFINSSIYLDNNFKRKKIKDSNLQALSDQESYQREE